MNIDIDNLTEDELIELNQKIVERIKLLRAYQTHQEMMSFSPGDKVSFDPPGRGTQFGILIKYNKKTVTVLTESGQKWNVSPYLLRRVRDVQHNDVEGNVIDFQRKD